jgi:predicted acetyltransferase
MIRLQARRQPRKGHGARMLAMLLEKADQLGISEALLITSQDNVASQGVIERNGGRLISESYSEDAKQVLRRYLVPTTKRCKSRRDRR